MTTPGHHQTLRSRLLGLMVLRVVLAVAFLMVGTWFQLSGASYTQSSFYPFHAVVVGVGLLTILYALALNRVSSLRLFTYMQLTGDAALVTLIVFITGGIESYLSVLYLFAVIGGSILVGKRGGYYAASLSAIAYGILIDLDFYGALPYEYRLMAGATDPRWEDVMTTLATNILAFFTIAYLVGYLAEKTAFVERKLEEKEIDFGRLEALNRHIVENISSGIMTLDVNQRVTSFNKAATDITGLTLREVYYRDVVDIFPGLGDDFSLKPEVLSRGERQFTLGDGTERCLGFTVSKGEGGDMTSIVIFQDLTELKALEERLHRYDKLKALGELSASLAHEVRNPLASISGSIQLLSRELKLGGEKRRLMDIVLSETERLNSLITDFLVFAKPAKGVMERMLLSDVISETLDIFRNNPDAAGIEVFTDVAAEAGIEGDRRQLSQVFWNLFLNAASAMPDGGTLSVSSVFKAGASKGPADSGEGHDEEGRFVEVTVRDTGTGIDPGELDKIFDPFFSTREDGTGLGLALVHRIVVSHGGSIDVESAPGKGTLFKVLFPLAAGAQVH